jgi:tetratricopeptide (TPR) repeat protein
MERREEASALIEQVIAQAPPESDDARAARQLLGLLRMAAGEWDQAADAFNKIYHANEATADTSLRLTSEAYLEKARAEMQVGAHDEAIAAIDQAIAVYREQSGQESLRQRTVLRLLRARLLAQFGRFEAAIQDLQTLTGQQPENYEALITLASLYASVDRWESLEAVIKPIASRPELQDIALYLEGRAALAKNRVGTARAKFEAAIDALPKEADLLRRSLYFYRGVCLQKLDRSSEADISILNAVDAGFRPETSEEALIASRSLLRAKRAAEAIPILEAITLNRIAPGAAVWAMLGRAHLATDTPALALSALNESLKVQPDQAQTRALRGSLLRTIGDLGGALADYEAALQITPENPSIIYACGLTYLQLGQLDKARVKIGEASQLLPENAGIQLLHALLAYTTKDLPVAKQALTRYFKMADKNPNETAFYLEYAIAAQHDTSLAVFVLNQRLISRELSPFLQKFIRYNVNKLDRKAIIDHAGIAESPQAAKRQICEAAFWLAQHERAIGNTDIYKELLQLAVKVGNADLTEYQLAKWQLEN